MGIDIELFEKEGEIMVRALQEGSEFAREGDYEAAIREFTNVEIAAGRLLFEDREVGEAFGFDRMILVAKAFQLKSFVAKANYENDKIDDTSRARILKVSKGPVDPDNNPYSKKILNAFRAWDEGGYLELLKLPVYRGSE